MSREAGGQLVERGGVVLCLDDFAGLVGTIGLRGDDFGGRDGAAFGNGLGAYAALGAV